jgi:beta-lactamase class C
MKIRHPFILGLLVVIVPLLVAQVITREQAPDAPVKKAAAPPKRAINPHLKELLKEYEDEILKLSKASHTPGAAIAVVYDSTIVYIKGFGLRNVLKPDSVDINTVFRIASVSKCFAAFLAGSLVEDSLLAWNDTVVHYLPTFHLKPREETGKLTVRHVLSHTTGLPYHAFTNMVEEGASLDSMLSWLGNINLASPVGQSYSYQNVAYSIVGKVIESRTGKSYNEQLRDRVFLPLKMTNASVDYVSMMKNINIATPHMLGRGKSRPAKITDTYYNVAPAGGVNASISDMANWMIALLGNRPDVINPETLKELYTPKVKAPSKNRNYGRMHRLSSSYYGLGWRVLHYPNDTLIYHGGYVNGYRSEVAINPKERIAVCILANAPGDLADNGIPLFFNLYEARRDSIVAWEKKRKPLPEKLALP